MGLVAEVRREVRGLKTARPGLVALAIATAQALEAEYSASGAKVLAEILAQLRTVKPAKDKPDELAKLRDRRPRKTG